MRYSFESQILTIPDYPKPGVLFRDLTTLFQDASGWKELTHVLCEQIALLKPDKLVGIEARGFPLGGAVAYELGCGLVLARKKGKLPRAVFAESYELEYGLAEIEIHQDAIRTGERCVIIDDVLATGGTAQAVASLVLRAGGDLAGCAFVVSLAGLGGSARLTQRGYPLIEILQY